MLIKELLALSEAVDQEVQKKTEEGMKKIEAELKATGAGISRSWQKTDNKDYLTYEFSDDDNDQVWAVLKKYVESFRRQGWYFSNIEQKTGTSKVKYFAVKNNN